MARNLENVNCPFIGTEDCALINAQSCADCLAAKQDPQQVWQELNALRARVPVDANLSVHAKDADCCFCKKKQPNKASGYVLIDMGHPEPKRTTNSLLYPKAGVQSGLLLPVQIPCCDKCRSRLKKIQYIPTVVALIVAIAALVVLTLNTVWQSLYETSRLLPIVLFIAAILIALLLRYVTQRALVDAYGRKTRVSPMTVPYVKRMRKCGWEPLNYKKVGSILTFADERLKSGIYAEASARASDSSKS